MDRFLLAAAAVAAAAFVPATAAFADHPGGHAGQERGFPVAAAPGFDGCRGISTDRHDRRRHRDSRCSGGFGGWVYADGQWALYNNRSFAPDSYNDWWHDRPDRAYPRWVQEQRGGSCDPSRMWWSGSGWHC